MPSPYEAVLGERMRELHPRLRAYFSEIPPGSHGHGIGSFDVVGTPRRWLWPALAMLSRASILFPVWQHDVPFTVTNSPTNGMPAVSAARIFAFAADQRTMIDEIAVDNGVLVDRLGSRRRLVATFAADIAESGLSLTSDRVGVRAGSRTIWMPRRLSPVVTLHERFDEAEDVQRVGVVVTHPLLGRLYEYAGSFVYEIRAGEAAS